MMRLERRRSALLFVAALAVIAAGFLAASRSGKSAHIAPGPPAATRSVTQGDFALAASYMGISEPQLRKALRGGSTLGIVADKMSGRSAAGLELALIGAGRARLDAAVRAGRLSTAQELTRLRALRRHSEAEIGLPGARTIGDSSYPAAVTRYLGITVGQLRSERRAGKSLAEVADAIAGKSATGLIDALVRDRRATLDSATRAGLLGHADEARLLVGLARRVSRRVELKPPLRR